MKINPNPFGTLLQKAIYRYRVAKFFGLPFYRCIQAFFSFRKEKIPIDK